jgi:transposase
MANRRKYSAEYKQEAVGVAKSGTKPISQVAHELGINVGVLSRWCREMEVDGGTAFRGQGKPRDEELASLKRELVQVRKERDFLKEAAAFFARESK